MNNLGKNIRLTDELERQLMMQAIEEQFRLKPGVALKNLLVKMAALFHVSKTTGQSHPPIKAF